MQLEEMIVEEETLEELEGAVARAQEKLEAVRAQNGAYLLATIEGNRCGVSGYGTALDRLKLLMAAIDAVYDEAYAVGSHEKLHDILEKFLHFLRQTKTPADATAEPSCRLEDYIIRVPF